MKIVVFGATGGAGKELVTQALQAGHEVTAVARNPANVTTRHERLKVVQGDISNAESITKAIAGQEAVVLSVGPRPGTPAGTLISDATRHALDGMKQHGVRRILIVSGLMVGPGAGLGAFGRFALGLFRRLNGALFRDKLKADQMVMDSGLEWIIVRPPVFTDMPPAGKYRMGENLDVAMFKKMANRDVADAILAALTDAKYQRKILEVSV